MIDCVECTGQIEHHKYNLALLIIKIGIWFSDMLHITALCKVSTWMDNHRYSDNTTIYISLATPDSCPSLNRLSYCPQDVSLWMKTCKLKCNAGKTEFITIGTPTHRRKLDCFLPIHNNIIILSHNVTPAASLLNLGVTFYENVNFKQFISNRYPLLILPYPRSSPVYLTFLC